MNSEARKRTAAQAAAERVETYSVAIEHGYTDLTTWQERAERAEAQVAAVREEVWDEALRWVRQQAGVTSPDYVVERIDRAEPFNPYRAAPTAEAPICWLCKHPCVKPDLRPGDAPCDECGCLAHYPPWPAPPTAALDTTADTPTEPDADEHEHVWQRHQNVTSKGYVMPPYEACDCGEARNA